MKLSSLKKNDIVRALQDLREPGAETVPAGTLGLVEHISVRSNGIAVAIRFIFGGWRGFSADFGEDDDVDFLEIFDTSKGRAMPRTKHGRKS